MRKPVVGLIFFLLAAPTLFPASAVFSANGEIVYRIKPNANGIERVDLIGRRMNTLPFKPPEGEARVVDLSRDDKGRLLIATPRILWRHDAEKNAWTKLCTLPDGELTAVACNPVAGAVLLLSQHEGEGAWWLLESDTSQLKHIRVRRHDTPEWRAPIFDAAGMLFVAHRYDVWCGSIEREEDKDETGGFSLSAERCLPLATFETANMTPAQTGAGDIAPSDGEIFVFMHRLGGSGIYDLLRLPKPDRERRGYKELGEILRQTESIYEELVLAMCLSPDGKTLYFSDFGDHYLYREGKLEKLTLQEPGPSEP